MIRKTKEGNDVRVSLHVTDKELGERILLWSQCTLATLSNKTMTIKTWIQTPINLWSSEIHEWRASMVQRRCDKSEAKIKPI